MKIKGAELKIWMDEAWPGNAPGQEGNWYWDHDLFDAEPDPEVIYDTDEIGNIYWQGPANDNPVGRDGVDIAKLIRKWQKERDFDIITYRVAKDKADEFRAMAKQFGCTEGKG